MMKVTFSFLLIGTIILSGCVTDISNDSAQRPLCDNKINELFKIRNDYKYGKVIPQYEKDRALELCNSIENNDCKEECFFALVSVGISDDISFCEFSHDKIQKERCYVDIALRTDNISICNKVTTIFDWGYEKSNMTRCYHFNDLSDDSKMVEEYKLCADLTPKSVCRLKFANDYEDCDELFEEDEILDYCYMNFFGWSDFTHPDYEYYKSFECNNFHTENGKEFCEKSKKEEYQVNCCSSP